MRQSKEADHDLEEELFPAHSRYVQREVISDTL